MRDSLQVTLALLYLDLVMNIVGMYGHCAFVHLLGQSFLVFTISARLLPPVVWYYNQWQAFTVSSGLIPSFPHNP